MEHAIDHPARHRRRPRRLCRGDPRRATRHRHHAGRRRPARRHLPQHRLHSVQGADPRRRASSRRPAITRRTRRSASTSSRRASTWRRRCAGRTASSRRLTSGVAALLKKNGVQVVSGWARIVDGKTVEVTTGDGAGAAAHRLRAPVARHRLAGGGAAGDALRRPRHLVDRSAVAAGAAAAPGRRRRRLHRAGTRHRLSQAGRRGRRWSRHWSACCRPTTTNSPSRWPRRCGGSACNCIWAARVQGLNASGDAVRIRNAQGEESALPADQVLVAVGRRPRTEGWGLETPDARHERPRRAHRRRNAARRCATSGRSAT